MSKAIYLGSDGNKSSSVTAIDIGINNIAHSVTHAYIGDINGKAQQVFPLSFTLNETVDSSTTTYQWYRYTVSTEWDWAYSSDTVSFSENDYITEMMGFTIGSDGMFYFEGANNWRVGYDMGDFSISGNYWALGDGSSASVIYESTDVLQTSKTTYIARPLSLYTYQKEISGSYIDTVTSTSRSAYPDDGSKSGYYYIYKGTTTSSGTTTQAITYNQIKAIQSTGTQHINTGFTANQNTRIIISMEPLSVANVSSGIGHVSYGAGNYYDNSRFESLIWDGQYEFNYGNQTQYATFTANVGDKLIIDQNKNVVSISINGEQQTLTFNSTSFTSSSPLVLFALNRDGNASTYRGISRIYYCKIYDNDVLVRSFIPVKGSNNAVGLYDLVNNKFYGNNGSGSFTAIE